MFWKGLQYIRQYISIHEFYVIHIRSEGKKKVELSLCLIKHHAMKTYKRVEV
jgi:hypothetical protein